MLRVHVKWNYLSRGLQAACPLLGRAPLRLCCRRPHSAAAHSSRCTVHGPPVLRAPPRAADLHPAFEASALVPSLLGNPWEPAYETQRRGSAAAGPGTTLAAGLVPGVHGGERRPCIQNQRKGQDRHKPDKRRHAPRQWRVNAPPTALRRRPLSRSN